MIHWKKGDFFLAAFVLALSIGLFVMQFLSSSGSHVTITVDNKPYQTVPLSRNQTIVVEQNGHKNIILIENNTVRITEADCPDGLCVGQGAISRAGQSIVCLPARVAVIIEGDGVDAVVY